MYSRISGLNHFVPSLVYGMTIYGNQIFFKSYEKLNYTSFLGYLRVAHKKFVKISVLTEHHNTHPMIQKICKRTRMSNWHVYLGFSP